MKSDSHDFIVKTNSEVDEWMATFYADGRKADHRLHCQWAWQEQERRKDVLQGEIDSLKNELAERDQLLLDIEVTMDQQPGAVSLGYGIECRMAAIKDSKRAKP